MNTVLRSMDAAELDELAADREAICCDVCNHYSIEPNCCVLYAAGDTYRICQTCNETGLYGARKLGNNS